MSKEIENMERLIENKGFQFRNFMGGIEARKKDETMTVSGMPVVFESETLLFKYNNEAYYEVIDRKALDDCDMTDVIFNMNHGGRVYAKTRNNSLKLKKTKDGLEMSAELWEDDERHKELYRDIQRGNLDKMSFAFTVKDDTYIKEDGPDGERRHVRRITGIDKLYDVSVVDIPAYDATSISARKAFDAESERRAAESMAESRNRADKVRRDLLKAQLGGLTL